MLLRKKKLIPGQNIRYIGKAFPGFVTGHRYMVFVAYKSTLEILVTYNGVEMVVFEYLTEPLES